MGTVTLHLGQAYSRAWKAFKKNAGIHIAVFFLVFILSFITIPLVEYGRLFFFVHLLINVAITLFIVGYTVAAVKSDVINIGTIIADSLSFKKFFQYFLYYIAMFIIVGGVLATFVMLGFSGQIIFSQDFFYQIEMPPAIYLWLFLAFIILMIYVSLRLMFVLYFIVENDDDFISAIQHSWEVTGGNVFTLFLFGLTAIPLFILSLITFGLGFLVVFPLLYLVQAVMYLTLKKAIEPGAEEPVT